VSKRGRRLVAIVAGVAVVLCAACVILLVALRNPARLYPADGSPESVARNYQLALVRGNYDVAYGFLSPSLDGYPTSVEQFERNLVRHSDLFSPQIDVCMYVESFAILGNTVTVTLREQWYDGCNPLFPVQNLAYHFVEMQLEREGDAWRVVDSSHHFAACWTQSAGCP
jgi:hypothetical protein